MKKIKNFIKKSVLMLVLLTISISLCACATENKDNNIEIELESPDLNSNWGDIGNEGSSEDNLDDDLTPNTTITIIGSGSKEEEILKELEEQKVTNIESVIYSSVSLDLEEAGFEVGTGVAYTAENNNYANLGIYYHSDEFNLFSDSQYRAVGFVEIVQNTEKYYNLGKEESLVLVDDIDENVDQDIFNIVTYNYQNINSYHFIYQNKYVTYYQQEDYRIVYSIEENIKENYDLYMGSLYDYDNKMYIYDESIFGPYTNHSGNSLFSEEDYKQLENNLKEFSNLQEQNGYTVEEYQIIYISPESIQDYINSEEEDTFYGFSVEELTSEFGLGTALEYTSEGFKTAQILTEDDKGGYNWKSFLIKVGIGVGIIIVSATVSHYALGVKFGCALVTMVKGAIIPAFVESIGTLGIATAESLLQGESIEESLKNGVYNGLDAFANTFLIGSAIAGVGVATGVIKTKACFKAGTPVLVDIINGKKIYKAIEDIKVGDVVVSYDEKTGLISKQRVSDLMVKQTSEIVRLVIDGEEIIATPNHPFYSPILKDWVSAESLKAGSYILNSSGNYRVVDEVEKIYLNEPINVYNFTVENTHTYFVGEEAILVHNTCQTLQGQRNKAVNDAWKREKEKIENGIESIYNWTPAQKAEILKNGSLKGWEGAHILDVSKLKGTAYESLISNPDNIILVPKSTHREVLHGGNTRTNPTDVSKVVKLGEHAAKIVENLCTKSGACKFFGVIS